MPVAKVGSPGMVYNEKMLVQDRVIVNPLLITVLQFLAKLRRIRELINKLGGKAQFPFIQ